jgi:predicted dehydrogenase
MLNVGFLGAGRVAQWHARFFNKNEIEGAKVHKVCDLDLNKAKNLAVQMNCLVSNELNEMLADEALDVLLILTESGKHFEHARDAISAGKHVIVEKPPCMFPEQISELSALAKERGVMFAPIFQNRFNPAVKITKQAMDEGRLGRLVSASIKMLWCRYQDYYEDGWHGTWRMDGGVINQQAIHHIDALHWLCGSIEKVSAFQERRLNKLEAEDTTVGIVKFKKGALGSIEVTTAARPDDVCATLSVVGENGIIELGGVALNEVTRWDMINRRPEDADIIRQYSRSVENGYGYSHGPLLQEIFNRINREVVDSVIEIQSTVETMRLIHALYRSNEDQRPILISEDLRSQNLGF